MLNGGRGLEGDQRGGKCDVSKLSRGWRLDRYGGVLKVQRRVRYTVREYWI